MKNVLLPTDLTVQSLSPIHDIVKDAKNQKVSILLVHTLQLPTSITDLLFIEENKPYTKVPFDFIEGLQMLRNTYKDSVQSIEFSFMYCTTSRYFNNFIEGNAIEAVYVLDNYNYKQLLQQSQSFTNFIANCKVPVIKLPVQSGVVSEYQILSSLLTSNDKKSITSTNAAKTAISYS